jgi:hypothetical protein
MCEINLLKKRKLIVLAEFFVPFVMFKIYANLNLNL